MSTLLESRIRHRLLSRKARETEIDNEDPPRRRVPCPDRDGATNVCFPKILSNSSAVDDALRKSSPAYRRGQGSTDALIRDIYPNIDQVLPPPSYFLEPIILAPRNSDVDDLNRAILNRFPGHEYVFNSADSIEMEDGISSEAAQIPVEYLRSIEASGLPPGELHLKLGCPLILLRNLAPSRGLCNGTHLILHRATSRVLEVQIQGGEHSQAGLSFQLCRRQFPVRLAFTLTINKAQGQSVRHVGIDLREPVFSHGQLYVAFSRATSYKRVKVLLPSPTSPNRLQNVVYTEIFHML